MILPSTPFRADSNSTIQAEREEIRAYFRQTDEKLPDWAARAERNASHRAAATRPYGLPRGYYGWNSGALLTRGNDS